MTSAKMTKAIDTSNSIVAIEKEIASVLQHWTKARDGVQQVLVSIVSLVRISKSQEAVPRLVNLLLDGMGNGVNGNAIRDWSAKHLNTVVNKEGKVVCRKYDAKAISSTAVASKSVWYDFRPVTATNPVKFDLDAQIIALLKKAQKMAGAKPKANDRIVVQATALDALVAMSKASEVRIAAAKAALAKA
jgi:hypothetical protein